MEPINRQHLVAAWKRFLELHGLKGGVDSEWEDESGLPTESLLRRRKLKLPGHGGKDRQVIT